MEIHTGRLIDHVHLRSRDLPAAKQFYAAIFDVLQIPWKADDTHLQADEFWLDAGDSPSHVHLAFQTPDRETVDRVYKAALAAGGRDTARPASGATTPATTRPSCWTRTATTSRR